MKQKLRMVEAADVLCWHIQRGIVDNQISENLAKLQHKPLVGIAIPDSALDQLEEELLRIAKENSESPQRFSDAVTEILKVPHTEIKLRLDEERNVKKKWKKAKKSSASREGA
jgi:seryl-tRNA synthetase